MTIGGYPDQCREYDITQGIEIMKKAHTILCYSIDANISNGNLETDERPVLPAALDNVGELPTA